LFLGKFTYEPGPKRSRGLLYFDKLTSTAAVVAGTQPGGFPVLGNYSTLLRAMCYASGSYVSLLCGLLRHRLCRARRLRQRCCVSHAYRPICVYVWCGGVKATRSGWWLGAA
jgi:hypothetical protein